MTNTPASRATRLLQGQGDDLAIAAAALQNGQLVAFPTETVYGLGGLVSQPEAVAGIFTAKGRPSDHPLIAHAAPGFDWAGWADVSSPAAGALIQAFWPGPLTLIVPKGPKMPSTVSGGQESVGIRCPSHPVAQALLALLDAPVAAPSANRFGKVSPTQARHVMDELNGRIAAVVEGGPAEVGIESTIVSVLDGRCVILRPGVITAEDIQAKTGLDVMVPAAQASNDQPRVSGSLEKHYSPDARLLVVSDGELNQIPAEIFGCRRLLVVGWTARFLSQVGVMATKRHMHGIEVQTCANQARSVAHDLYSLLRRADEQHFDVMIIEKPPEEAAWQGIADRLKRAAVR